MTLLLPLACASTFPSNRLASSLSLAAAAPLPAANLETPKMERCREATQRGSAWGSTNRSVCSVGVGTCCSQTAEQSCLLTGGALLGVSPPPKKAEGAIVDHGAQWWLCPFCASFYVMDLGTDISLCNHMRCWDGAIAVYEYVCVSVLRTALVVPTVILMKRPVLTKLSVKMWS